MTKTMGQIAFEAFFLSASGGDPKILDHLEWPGGEGNNYDAVADAILEEAAKVATEHNWQLPMFDTQELNDITDNVAESIQRQVADAIRALKASPTTSGDRTEYTPRTNSVEPK